MRIITDWNDEMEVITKQSEPNVVYLAIYDDETDVTATVAMDREDAFVLGKCLLREGLLGLWKGNHEQVS